MCLACALGIIIAFGIIGIVLQQDIIAFYRTRNLSSGI